MKIWQRFSLTAVLVATSAVAIVLEAPTPVAGGHLSFPARMLDTRPGQITVDGARSGEGMVRAGSTVELGVAGRGSVPAGLHAVAVNVTVTEARNYGYITVFDCEAGRPLASNVNYAPRQTIANSSVVRVSATGTICLYTLADAHLVVDVTSVFAEGGVEPVGPSRLLDTRSGQATVDGRHNGEGRVGPLSVTELQVLGRRDVPSHTVDVALNVAVTNPDAAGYVSVYNCDTARPLASTVNYSAGQTISNATIVRLDTGGSVCLFTLAGTDLIVDITGVFHDGLTPIGPSRFFDSRPGERTFDNRLAGPGYVSAGATTVVPIVGREGVAGDADAVAVNVAVTEPAAAGYITLFACDDGRPTASNLNFVAGETISNAAITQLSDDGSLCVYTSAATHVIVDVMAAFSERSFVPPVTAPGGGHDHGSQPGSPPGLTVDAASIPGPAVGSNQRLVGQAQHPFETPGDGVAAMRVSCRYSHMAYNDPIVAPGVPGGSHLHAFYGNTSINAYSGQSRVADTGTSTCSGGTLNRTGYWSPAIVDTSNNRAVNPVSGNSTLDFHAMQAYYKSGYQGVAPQQIQSFPAELRIIAGDMRRTTAEPANGPQHVSYHCVTPGAETATPPQGTFPSCSPGQVFVMKIIFPQCWNGRDLDSPDHKSHMAYGTWGRVSGQNGAGCPPSHPVALPEITLNFRYVVPAGGMSTWRLVSDTYSGPAGYSGHADWWMGWEPSTFQRVLDGCFRPNLDCDMNLLGDGQALLPA